MVEHTKHDEQGPHFHAGEPKGDSLDLTYDFKKNRYKKLFPRQVIIILDINDKKDYLLKKKQFLTKSIIKSFHSIKFEKFFYDEKILSNVFKIFEYEYPIYCQKRISVESNISDNIQWLISILKKLNIKSHFAIIFAELQLWCYVNVTSFEEFCKEMLEVKRDNDFTIIDTDQNLVFDFSLGEDSYEIRVLYLS